MDLTSPQNLCGQNLLRLTSRGSAIIAELNRLADNIPEGFLATETAKDPEQRKYLAVLFDFAYLRNPEDYEKRVNANRDLLDLEVEFLDNHAEILERFYGLYHSIYLFQRDLNKLIEDISNGFYIQHSFENIMDDIDGKQLVSESLYLYGVMLLLLEERIPGYVRERMLVCMVRDRGESSMNDFDEVCKLCRSTGYIPKVKKPRNHPESLFARFTIPEEIVRMIVGKLQMDDIYLMATSFPNPEYRTVRLANQASMLYVILFFIPEILTKDKSLMREIVDRHFNDTWVIPTYMGHNIDLMVEWANYPAAKAAIDTLFTPTFVKQLADKNAAMIRRALSELAKYLAEGVLLPDYLLDNMNTILNNTRFYNVALRWRMCHGKAEVESFKKIIDASGITSEMLVNLLLNIAHFEYVIKDAIGVMLKEKHSSWIQGRDHAVDRLHELSEYFTGEKALTRVKRDDHMAAYFSTLAENAKSLNMETDHNTATGRKIQSIIRALEDVEQFEAMDTNVQIKTYLGEIREILRSMIRTVNINDEALSMLEHISDFSYAWEVLPDFLAQFHEAITRDPSTVVRLRAAFLKAGSMLDVPLIRITTINSEDAVSVAEYYSTNLVEFVRRVLQVIPISIFKILREIVKIQNTRMHIIPNRLEAKDLKEYADLDERFELSKLTFKVSQFTEGVLLMEKTLLGVIQVEPRQILEDGLRCEIVRQVSYALYSSLSFKNMTREEINKNLSHLANTLDGIKRSIEYLQDYIGIAGLKIFQEEFGRVINYNAEQEANRYLKRKIFDSVSRYQSREVPIPRFTVNAEESSTPSSDSINFMGRIATAMLILTDSAHTVFAPECAAWYTMSAPDQKFTPPLEVCGIRFFALLERSLGANGLKGLDKLLSFRTVYEFNGFIKFYDTKVKPFKTLLEQVRDGLYPEHRTGPATARLYATAVRKVENLMLPILICVRRIGQSQLIRRQLNSLMRFGCQLDAHNYYLALDTFNRGLTKDMKNHNRHPDKYPYPNQEMNPLLFEVSELLSAAGMDDPLEKIYITTSPLEGLPQLLFLFLLTYLPKLEYDANFGTLVRKKASFPLDGTPLAVGLACLLKQFHPSTTKQLLCYLGQFVRCSVQVALEGAENSSKIIEIPAEVLNTLVFMNQLCQYSAIPKEFVHNYVPAYIFDSIKFTKAKN
jgi:WASH complex subunit strumpellin